MKNKKYYSISEVANYLGVSAPTLRYLEKTIPKLKIHQIRGRRYYSAENLAFLKSRFDNVTKPVIQQEMIFGQDELIMRISYIESRFIGLRDMLSYGLGV